MGLRPLLRPLAPPEHPCRAFLQWRFARAARLLLRELPSPAFADSGDIAAVFIRKAALPPTAEASLRAAQCHPLTVVENVGTRRFRGAASQRARPVGRRVIALRRTAGAGSPSHSVAKKAVPAGHTKRHPCDNPLKTDQRQPQATPRLPPVASPRSPPP